MDLYAALVIAIIVLLWIGYLNFTNRFTIDDVTVLDWHTEGEELRKKYPALTNIWEELILLQRQVIRQDWIWDRSRRPAEPLTAFWYHFIARRAWKRKIKRLAECKDEYDFVIKLVKDHTNNEQ